MNSKASTVALIIALGYEIIFKLGRMFFSSFIEIPFVSGLTRVLSIAAGIIIIIFMYYFYKEESEHKKIGTYMMLLIIIFIIQSILKLTAVRHLIGYSGAFFAAEVAGFIKAVLLFIVITIFIKIVPPSKRVIKRSTVLVAVMFGIGIIKSLFALISYLRFMSSGSTVQFPPEFMNVFFIVFIVSHVSLIWFLYNYLHWKKGKGS